MLNIARKQVIGLQDTICRTLARYSVFLHQQQLLKKQPETGTRVPGYPFQYPSGTRVFKYPKVRALIFINNAQPECIAVCDRLAFSSAPAWFCREAWNYGNWELLNVMPNVTSSHWCVNVVDTEYGFVHKCLSVSILKHVKKFSACVI